MCARTHPQKHLVKLTKKSKMLFPFGRCINFLRAHLAHNMLGTSGSCASGAAPRVAPQLAQPLSGGAPQMLKKIGQNSSDPQIYLVKSTKSTEKSNPMRRGIKFFLIIADLGLRLESGFWEPGGRFGANGDKTN